MEKTDANKALIVTLDQNEALDQDGALTIPIVKLQFTVSDIT